MLFSLNLKQVLTWKYLPVALFLLVFVLSAAMRFKPVVEGTFPFFYDHGRDMLDVRKIVEDKNFTFIGPTTGLKGLYHGPLHYYLLSVGYAASGGNPASGVVMVVLMQLLGGSLCFFVGRRFWGNIFGLLLSALYLLSLNSINASSMFWNPYWIPSFMVLFYFASLAALRSGGKWWLAVGFLGGMVAQFEIAFGIFLIPFMFLSAVLFQKRFYADIYFWVSFVVFLVPFAPLIAFDVKNGFLMFKSILSVLNGSYVGLGDFIPLDLRWTYRFAELRRATFDALSYYSSVNLLIFVFALLGLASAVYKKNLAALQHLFLFALLPILVFAGFMVYSSPAWSYYWIGLQVSYYFFVAYSLYLLSQNQVTTKALVFLISLVFIASSLKIVAQDTTFSEQEPGIYRNQLAVVDSVFLDAAGRPFGQWVYTPPIYDYTYQYLFYWRGKTKYGISPEHTTKLPYYFIVEPNKERPWESNGWRKSVHGERTPEWSKKMSGDIIVEKYGAN